MLSIIAIILSLISIALMLIILIKFKKLFSTESIIEKTKLQMNRVIKDVNNNANRDLELINDATKRTRMLLNESEKQMESFKEATERLRNMIAETEKVSRVQTKTQPASSSIMKDETIITPDGAAYKEIPLIITKVYDDKTKEISKASIPFNEKVERLFNQGMQIEEIATELSCSISEVAFIIDML